MLKSKKIWSLMLTALLVFSLVLTGCGDKQPAGSSSGEEVDYPTRPITAICPWSAGGSSDIAFRAYMSYMAEELGVDINVQNITGGDGDIGYAQALAADPDGYTLVMLNYDLLSNAAKGITDTSYDDFAMINMFTIQDVNLVTHADYGWETFEDFRQAALGAKEKGQTLKIGVTGFWLHAAGMMAKEAGITDAVTLVPFSGSSDQVAELLGKHVDAVTTSTTAVLPHLQSVPWSTWEPWAPRETPTSPMSPPSSKWATMWSSQALEP